MLTLLQVNSEVLIQEAAAPEKMSLIKMAVAGGWLMLVLLALSIIAVYILGSRWWAIRQALKIDPHFMDNIRGLLREGKTQAALALCRDTQSKIEKGMPMLATVAGGAPMVGFLGTVAGMIQAFYNMARAGSNIDITLLSDGIYTAMVTTVGGLIVGIIAYFGYNWLTARIDDLVFKMDSAVISLMDIFNGQDSTDGKKEI